MQRELSIRALGLYLPVVVAGALWFWRNDGGGRGADDRVSGQRRLASVLLACAWSAPTLLIVHVVAVRAGYWTFHAAGALFAGIPFDLYLGWMFLWGAVPPLAFRSLPIPLVAALMVLLDLVLMPLCAPVVQLGDRWFIGEAMAVALVLMPAQYLARWTITNQYLERRTVLQGLAFSGLMLLVIPTAVLEQTGGTWQPLMDRSPRWNSLLAQLFAFPAILGLSAVQEFVVRGRGTPLPYDPPQRLVITGPYAYVANPMQLTTVMLFIVWASMLANVWMIGAGIVALAYGVGLAGWHEDEQLITRFGDAWVAYRRSVRRWWPRWYPIASQHGRIYVAEGCATCRGVGEWLTGRRPIGLDILAAETHPHRDLFRMTYEPDGGGRVDEGVAAFARALEHINLGWAFLGMFIRLPFVLPLLQLLVDASGGQPQQIPRKTKLSCRAPFRVEE